VKSKSDNFTNENEDCQEDIKNKNNGDNMLKNNFIDLLPINLINKKESVESNNNIENKKENLLEKEKLDNDPNNLSNNSDGKKLESFCLSASKLKSKTKPSNEIKNTSILSFFNQGNSASKGSNFNAIKKSEDN